MCSLMTIASLTMTGIQLRTLSPTILQCQQGSKKSMKRFTSRKARRFLFLKWIRKASQKRLLKTIWPTTRGTLKNLFAWSNPYSYTPESLMPKTALRPKNTGFARLTLKEVTISGLNRVKYTMCLNLVAQILLLEVTGVSPSISLTWLCRSLAISCRLTTTSQLTNSFTTTSTIRDFSATKPQTQAAQWLSLAALLWINAQKMEPAI